MYPKKIYKKPLGWFLICLISFWAYPRISWATISTCVVSDDSISIPAGCIRFAALDGWLRSPALHDEFGNLRDDVLIELKPGVYRPVTSFTIDRSITGNGRYKFLLTGSGSTKTIFSGARPLRFIPVPPALLKRKNLPSNLVVASLKEAGIKVPKFSDKKFGRPDMPELELFYRGKRMPIARWPNSGYAKTDTVEKFAGEFVFSVKGKDIAAYKTEQDLRVGGYFMHDWADEKFQVEKIDSSSRVRLFGSQPHYGVAGNRRVFFENALIDIDKPGEWHIDSLSDEVYFLPPKILQANEVQISQLVNGLLLKGVENVEVRDIGFEAFRGEGILLRDVDTVRLKNLAVKNVGMHGVSVYGQNTVLEGITIENTGATGIGLNGGNRKTLEPGLIVARHCVVTQVGRLQKTYAPAVSLAGVGNTVEDSVLRSGPHAAIIFHGNDHHIRRNLIENFVEETDDAGAIYTGRDWSERGTVIEQNLIRNIGSAGLHYGAHAIYLDDQASGINVKNNLISHVGRGVFIGGGRDNTVSDNIFANCNAGVYLDGRGRIALAKQGASANQDYVTKIRSVGASSPLYTSRYPGLGTLLGDEPGVPKNNVVDRNVFMDCGLPYIKRQGKDGISISGSVIVNKTEKKLIDSAKVDMLPELLTVLRAKGRTPQPDEAIKVID